MYLDGLRQFLASLELRNRALFGSDAVARWAPGERDALVAAGVLMADTASGTVICDGCDEGCQEDVEFVEADDEDCELRAYVTCHTRDLGRVKVSLDSLESWRPSAGGLARWIAAQLALSITPEECVTDRLWWIGRPTLGHRRADLFLARGSAWADAGAVLAGAPRLVECARPVVLVPWEAPKTSPFPATVETLSLARLLSLDDGQLRLELPVPEVAAQEAGEALLTIHGPDVTYLGQPVKLQPGDRLLLRVLACDPQYWLSIEHLSREAWEGRGTPNLDAVKASIKRVRNALTSAASRSEPAPVTPPDQVIRNQPKSFGSPSKYMLNLDANQVEVTGE